MAEPLLTLLEPSLQPLAVRDVREHHDRAFDDPRRVMHRSRDQVGFNPRPVLSHADDLAGRYPSLVEERMEPPAEPLDVVGNDERVEVPHGLLGAPAKDPLRLTVPEADRPRGVQRDYRKRRRVDQGPQSLVDLRQEGLLGLPLGHVLLDGEELGDGPVGVLDRRNGGRGPIVCPRLGLVVEFTFPVLPRLDGVPHPLVIRNREVPGLQYPRGLPHYLVAGIVGDLRKLGVHILDDPFRVGHDDHGRALVHGLAQHPQVLLHCPRGGEVLCRNDDLGDAAHFPVGDDGLDGELAAVLAEAYLPGGTEEATADVGDPQLAHVGLHRLPEAERNQVKEWAILDLLQGVAEGIEGRPVGVGYPVLQVYRKYNVGVRLGEGSEEGRRPKVHLRVPICARLSLP